VGFLRVIEERRAYRALSSANIDKEILVRLAEAAHMSPSSMNNQPWRIITVTSEPRLNALKETLTAGNYWARPSPAISAFVTNPDWSMRLGARDLAYFELGMAAMAYQLQGVAEGLHVHPIVGFNADSAKKVLEIPETETLEILVVLGYPGDVSSLNEKHQAIEAAPRSRKPLNEIAAFDVWDERLRPMKKA
jgi:nitroreductase